MSSNELRESLQSIRAELAEPGAVDDASRELLEQVAADIERVLDEEDATTPETVRGKMEKVAIDFEADHPRMARVMNEIVDALARMGI